MKKLIWEIIEGNEMYLIKQNTITKEYAVFDVDGNIDDSTKTYDIQVAESYLEDLSE